MSEEYQPYQPENDLPWELREPEPVLKATGAVWRVVIEYFGGSGWMNAGRQPTRLVEGGGGYETLEQALKEARREAFEFEPPDPMRLQERRVYQDGQGFLVVLEGARSTYHFSTRVVRFLAAEER